MITPIFEALTRSSNTTPPCWGADAVQQHDPTLLSPYEMKTWSSRATSLSRRSTALPVSVPTPSPLPRHTLNSGGRQGSGSQSGLGRFPVFRSHLPATVGGLEVVPRLVCRHLSTRSCCPPPLSLPLGCPPGPTPACLPPAGAWPPMALSASSSSSSSSAELSKMGDGMTKFPFASGWPSTSSSGSHQVLIRQHTHPLHRAAVSVSELVIKLLLLACRQ